MSIELKEVDKSDSEHALLDESQKAKVKAKEEEETRKSVSSPQRKHSLNVVPFSTSLKDMKEISKFIQDVI